MSAPLNGEQGLLRIFGAESDQIAGKPFHMTLVSRARRARLAGCTVARGIASFGRSGVTHSDTSPDYAADLPVVVEIVDTSQKIRAFLSMLEKESLAELSALLVTEEKIGVCHYQARGAKP